MYKYSYIHLTYIKYPYFYKKLLKNYSFHIPRASQAVNAETSFENKKVIEKITMNIGKNIFDKYFGIVFIAAASEF